MPGLAGCLFSPDRHAESSSLTPPPPPPPPPPGGPDTTLAQFKLAYTSMDIDRYRECLGDNFRFVFNPSDVALLNLPASCLTRAQDLAATANIFSGNPLTKPNEIVPGVKEIRITRFDRAEPWVREGPDHPEFPNTDRATYDVEMSIERLDASSLLIAGQQMFYVSYRDSVIGGAQRRVWKLTGQRDLTSATGSKGVGQDSWGSIKVLYYNLNGTDPERGSR